MTNINTLINKISSKISFDRFNAIYISLFYLALLVVTYVLIWISFRGLDITDESFYIIGYLQGIEPAFSYSQFHKIYNVFVGFLDLTIVKIRIFRIALSIITSLFFSYSLINYLEKNKILRVTKTNFKISAITIIIGSFMSYTWLPQTLSYNIFSFLFLQITLSLFFLIETTKKPLKKHLLKIIVGFFLAASFYNKFPNFIIALFLLLIISLLTQKHKSAAKKLIDTCIDLTIYSFGFTIFSLILFQETTFEQVESLLTMILASGEKSSFNYKEIYLKDLNKLISRTYPYLIFLALWGVLYAKIKKTKQIVLDSLLELILVLFILAFSIISFSYLGGVSRKYLHFDFYLICSFAFFIILILNKKILQKSYYNAIIVFLTLNFFLAGSLGTNNGLSAQFMIYISFMMASFLIVVFSINKRFLKFLMVIIILTASSQIVTGVLLDPYREYHGVFAQNNEVFDLKGFSKLKLDSATYNLKKQLHGVRLLEANHLFVYSHQSGIALLTEKTPYGFGWYSPSNPSFCVNLIEHASYVDEADLIFIIPSKIEMHKDVKMALNKRGIHFPENYRLYNQIIFEDCKKGKKIKLNIYEYKKID